MRALSQLSAMASLAWLLAALWLVAPAVGSPDAIPLSPKAPEGTVLSALPGAAQLLTASGGWVIFSEQNAQTHRWQLEAWHGGTTTQLPVGTRAVPFDAAAGTDARGRTVVVYSRCAKDPPAVAPEGIDPYPEWWRARGCRIYELRLGAAAPAPVAGLARSGASDTTPSISHGMLAFARLQAGRRYPNIYLWKSGSLRRLPGGTHPRGGGNGWAEQISLGPHGLALLWDLYGESVVGIGDAEEVQFDALQGGFNRFAETGYISGACGFREPFSPNVIGEQVLYVDSGSPCDVDYSNFVLFGAATRSLRAQAPASGFIAALARDGSTTYWIRDTEPDAANGHRVDDCVSQPTACVLVSSNALNPPPVHYPQFWPYAPTF
jgi:hypothetical protein